MEQIRTSKNNEAESERIDRVNLRLLDRWNETHDPMLKNKIKNVMKELKLKMEDESMVFHVFKLRSRSERFNSIDVANELIDFY